MSKLGGMIATFKVIAQKLGEKTLSGFEAATIEGQIKTSNIRPVDLFDKKLDIRNAEIAIKKAQDYFKYIDKNIDTSVKQNYGQFFNDLNRIEKGANIKEEFAKKVKTNLGINVEPDDFKDVKNIKKKVFEAGTKRILDRTNSEWLAELHGFGGNERIASVLSTSLKKPKNYIMEKLEKGTMDVLFEKMDVKDVININKDLYAAVSATRQIAFKTTEKAFNFTALDIYSGNIMDKLNNLHDVALRTGNIELAKLAEAKAGHITNATQMEASFKKAAESVVNLYENVPKERRRILATYIENRSKSKLSFNRMKDVYGVEKDVEADMGLAAELGMTPDEIMMSNRIGNFLRTARKYEYQKELAITHNDYDDVTRNLTSTMDHLGDDAVYFKDDNFSTDELGDLDINYFPISINDEHKMEVAEAIQKANPGKYNLNNHYEKQVAYNKSRRTGAVSNLDKNRRDPEEELKRYINSFSRNNTYTTGRVLIDRMYGATTIRDLLNESRKLQSQYQDYNQTTRLMLDNISKHWESIHATVKNPETGVGKFVAGLTDANTAFALGQSETALVKLLWGDVAGAVEGQKMPAFNYLTVLSTTAMFKGVLPTLAAMKDTPSHIKAYLKSVKSNGGIKKIFSPANIEASINEVVSATKSESVKKALVDYWKYESPDILMESLYTMDNKLQRLMNSVTTIFKMSDVASRNVTVTAAVKYGEIQYSKYEKAIADGSAKAIDRLVSDMHIFEFGSLDRKYILSAVKNKNEFLSRYARVSVRSEMFNYSRYFRPEIVDKARSHWATARAMRFLSWNMYYTQLLKGVHRSYVNGDPVPMQNMMKLAAMWFGSMSLLGSADDHTVKSYALYGIGRTPLVAPAVGTVTTSFRELTGILAPSLAAVGALAIGPADYIADAMQGQEKDKKGEMDMLDFAWNKTYNSVKNQPVAKPFIDFYKEIGGK